MITTYPSGLNNCFIFFGNRGTLDLPSATEQAAQAPGLILSRQALCPRVARPPAQSPLYAASRRVKIWMTRGRAASTTPGTAKTMKASHNSMGARTWSHSLVEI